MCLKKENVPAQQIKVGGKGKKNVHFLEIRFNLQEKYIPSSDLKPFALLLSPYFSAIRTRHIHHIMRSTFPCKSELQKFDSFTVNNFLAP